MGHSKSHQFYIRKVFQTVGFTFDVYAKDCLGIERMDFCSGFRILPDAWKMCLWTGHGLGRMDT